MTDEHKKLSIDADPNQSEIGLIHIVTVPLSLIFLRGQLRYLANAGFRATVISSPGGFLTTFGEQEDVRTESVSMPRRITPARDVIACIRLFKLLRALQPQIVHSHTPKAGLLGMIAAWLNRTPVRVYHLRGLPSETARGVRRATLATAEFIACRLSHLVICVSKSVRDVAVKSKFVSPEKIVVLGHGSGNGVDATERFNPHNVPDDIRKKTRSAHGIPAGDVVVGYVGRLVRDKGIIDLANAWEIVRREVHGVSLLLVGPLEEGDPIPASVRDRLERDPTVHVTGLLWDTVPAYSAMDIFVLPSYREGFPNGVLEASAMELPVIATRVSGCVDAVVDGTTGALVPPANSDVLASTILEYVRDPARRLREGKAGRMRVLEFFRPELVWDALRQAYDRLLHERGVLA